MHDELALFNNLEPMPTLLQGDARALPLGDESVDLIVTSPPYFGLRDYGTIGQIGSEPGPLEFIKALIACTREMVRVLKPSGSIFVNLNDKYNSAASGQNGTKSTGLYAGRCEPGTRAAGRHDRMSGRGRVHPGVPLKSLMLLPERYRVGCVDELGLTVRAVIVWEKANGLPEPVTDRVRRSHEDWVHLTKQARYYGATNEIREPNADGSPAGRLPSSVWRVTSQPLRVPVELGVSHHAAFPMEWPRRLIMGWCPLGGTVLDPFSGTGTTALVAAMLGRNGIGVELSAEYCRLAQWRASDPKQRQRAAQVPTRLGEAA